MKRSFKYLAAGLVLLAAQAHAGWTGAYYVDKIISFSANETIAGEPIVEVWQIHLSNNVSYAFYNKGAVQKAWIDLLVQAMGQGKKVQFYLEGNAYRTIIFKVRSCYDVGANYTCSQAASAQQFETISGMSLERQ